MVSVTDRACKGSPVVLDESFPGSEVRELRRRWELASVLNFLNVFEPVIGSDVKLTAEEIEMGLVESNTLNAQLHIALLKGIPPVSKKMNNSGEWVTALCKKLCKWWPWVAEGEAPIIASKGAEISRYRELDPTTRLRILKALCEIRADQKDAVSFVNSILKQGGHVTCFRKVKIGDDGNQNSYWCDGSTVQGYRLYRELYDADQKTRRNKKADLALPAVYFNWETLATSLEEFRRVSSELSSSKAVAEAATGKKIEADIIPVVEKLHKKKERALKRKQKQETATALSNMYVISRSCRSRRPVCYTSEEFDRTICEALQISEGIETHGEQKQKRKLVHEATLANSISDLKERSDDTLDDKSDDDYKGRSDEEDENGIDYLDDTSKEENGDNAFKDLKAGDAQRKHKGSRWSKRLAGESANPDADAEGRNVVTKRPLRNSAQDTFVMPNSDVDRGMVVHQNPLTVEAVLKRCKSNS